MAHPQNSPRGLFSKVAISVAEGKGVFFEDYSTGTAMLTADSTALQVAGGVRLSGKSTAQLTGDDRGILLSGSGVKFSSPRVSSSLPSTDLGASLRMVVNTTGETALAINTSSGRWKYFAVTGVLRTANVSN